MDVDMDARRAQVVQVLGEAGFSAEAIGQIIDLVDAIMEGRLPLAHVLVAATEACRVCGLAGTRQHVAEAVGCLAGEVAP